MFQPIRIIIKNFLSIQEIEYNFKTGETVLIQGINLTDEGQESNGSGKSAFQAAIDFIFTNSCPRKVSSDKELIRDGCDEAFLEMELDNTLYRCNLIITRTLSRSNSSTLKILENGENVKFPTVPEGNKVLMSFLAISLKDIHNYYLPNELTYISFFKSSDTEIKELISRFSKTTVIDGVFGYIEDDLQENDNPGLGSEITELETSIRIYDEQIQEEENRDFEKERKSKVDELNGKIDNKNVSLSTYKSQKLTKEKEFEKIETDIITLTEEVDRRNKELDEFLKKTDKEDFFKQLKETRDKLNEKNDKNKPKKKEYESKLQPLKNSLSALISQLSGKITCPKCKHEFVLNCEKSVEELQNDKTIYEGKIQALETNIKNVQKVLDEIQEGLDLASDLEKEVNDELETLRTSIKGLERKIKELKDSLSNKETERTKIKNSISTFQSNINITETEINSLREEIKNVKLLSKNTKLIEELKDKKKSCEDKLSSKQDEQKELEIKLQNIGAWTNRFKSFKSYLANKQLKTITGYTNHYLKQFGTDIEVSIEGYKQLASGEMRERVTAYVLRGGRSRSYGSLSKGERGKIDCAVMMALQTLINFSATSGGIDLLCADEIFEGMDSLGLTSLLLAMAKTKKTNLLTTHLVKNLNYDNILTFVKENNVTKIQ